MRGDNMHGKHTRGDDTRGDHTRGDHTRGDETSSQAADPALSPLSQTLLSLLKRYTPLANAVLQTQCKRAGFAPAKLGVGDLETLAPLIIKAVSRFTTPEKGRRLKAELEGNQNRSINVAANPSTPSHPTAPYAPATPYIPAAPSTSHTPAAPSTRSIPTTPFRPIAAATSTANTKHVMSASGLQTRDRRQPRLPAGVTVKPLTKEILRVLSTATPFAWPILQTQSDRLKVDPTDIKLPDLTKLIPLLERAVTRWSTPKKGALVSEKLTALAQSQ